MALARARAQLLFFLAESKRPTKGEPIRLAWLTLSRSDGPRQTESQPPLLRFADLRAGPDATAAYFSRNHAASPELAQALADPWFAGVMLTHPNLDLVGAWIAVLKPDAITITAHPQRVELGERAFPYSDLGERRSPPQRLLRVARHVLEILTALTPVAVLLHALGII